MIELCLFELTTLYFYSQVKIKKNVMLDFKGRTLGIIRYVHK